ncbi:MAG TPA: glycosyltransferase family 4 protein [Xanthobacteraceae bacterium]|nr:glycosyltransferase family 4 protein [Xanthobacteraceae bacterium]
MRRLIFINRFFAPDHSATSQILSDLAFDLAGAGRDVHLVTSRQIYDDPKAALPECETINGVAVHRVASTGFGRTALIGRSIDYASFYRSVWRRLHDLVRPGDIVIAKTDPPLISIVARPVARRNGARLVNWLQDIYPETAVELGVPLMRGPVAAGLATLRNTTLREAAATVVVGDLMGRKVEALGAPASRIHVIPNWCNDEDIRFVAPADNPLRREWNLADKFVLGYSGNLGRAHEFETVLAAAERLRDGPRVAFLMIGGGKRFEELSSAVQARGIAGSFRFLSYQARTLLSYSLGAADVHWVSLDPRLEGLIVPSKFYGVAAAGKPVVVIGAGNGELAQLVQRHDCGFAIAPGDSDTLAATLRRLSDAPQQVLAMGARARKMLDAHFTRRQGLARWRRLLDQLDAG